LVGDGEVGTAEGRAKENEGLDSCAKRVGEEREAEESSDFGEVDVASEAALIAFLVGLLSNRRYSKARDRQPSR